MIFAPIRRKRVALHPRLIFPGEAFCRCCVLAIVYNRFRGNSARSNHSLWLLLSGVPSSGSTTTVFRTFFTILVSGLVFGACSPVAAPKLKSKPTGHPLGAAYDVTRADNKGTRDLYAFYDGTGLARFMDGGNWVGLFDYNKRTALFGDTRTMTYVRGDIDPVKFPAVVDDNDPMVKNGKSLGTGVVRQFPCHKWKFILDGLACEVWTDDFDRFPVYYSTNSGAETVNWTVRNCWVDPSVLKVPGYFTLEDFVELKRVPEPDRDTVKWLQQFDRNNSVERIYLTSGQDDTLAKVASIPGVQALDLNAHVRVTNSGLSVLSEMHDLKVLRIDGSQITEAGLTKLVSLPALKSLQLHSPRLQDSVLLKLKGLSKLERLSLCETSVTGHGFKELCKLPSLQVLDLAKTKITDAHLANLSKCAALKDLRLDGNVITLQGLKNLLPIKSLKTVSALETGLTDEQISNFKSQFKVRLRYTD